jgi:integrase
MAEHRAVLRAARQTPMTPSQRARRPRKRPKKAPQSRYRTDSYGRAITDGIAKANADRAARGEPSVAHWHPHQLRHSAATAMRKEFGIDVARILLGHSSPTVTEIYAEIDATRAVDAARKTG